MDKGEKDPIGEIRRNRNTSLVRAFQAVRDKEVDGVVMADQLKEQLLQLILSFVVLRG